MLKLGVYGNITDHNLSSIGHQVMIYTIFERILNALSCDITIIDSHSKYTTNFILFCMRFCETQSVPKYLKEKFIVRKLSRHTIHLICNATYRIMV